MSIKICALSLILKGASFMLKRRGSMKPTTHLSEIPLFKGVPIDSLESLADILVEQTLKPGQIIFSEGTEATGFYAIISGCVKVFKVSPDGKEQIIHIFGPGEIFGEVPMFEGKNFPAHAEALERSRLFFFPKKSFIALIRRNPFLAMNMVAALSRRLKDLTRLIEGLSLKEVPGRLATYLLYLSDRGGGSSVLRLDIPKKLLASLLGTIPETLSRIFLKMNSRGIIKMKGRSITILDKEALKKISREGKLP
jgi:CRP/FNR family transcriptional regulator